MDVWDTARLLKTPGVCADVYIDPLTIPKRTKLSAQRMVRDGAYFGTWSSKSKQLAGMVRDTVEYLPFVSGYARLRPGGTHSWLGTVGLHNYTLSDETIVALVEFARADFTMYKMAHPEEKVSRYGGYLREQQIFLERYDKGDLKSINRLNFHFHDYALQAIDVVKATRTLEQVAQAEMLAAMLDSPERIYISKIGE